MKATVLFILVAVLIIDVECILWGKRKTPNRPELRGEKDRERHFHKKRQCGPSIKDIVENNVDDIDRICQLSDKCKETEQQVCGSDGTTYRSLCEFLARKCEEEDTETIIEQFGVCGEEPEKPNKLDLICEKSKNCLNTTNTSVCGSNNATYDSICELLSDKCENKDLNTTLKHFGDCGTEPEWPNKPIDPERKRAMCELHCSDSFDFENYAICGSDNVTYDNMSDFRIAKCIDMYLTIAKYEECNEDQGNPEDYCVKCPDRDGENAGHGRRGQDKIPRGDRKDERTIRGEKPEGGNPGGRKQEGHRPGNDKRKGQRRRSGRQGNGGPGSDKPGNRGPGSDRSGNRRQGEQPENERTEFEPSERQHQSRRYHEGRRGNRKGPHHRRRRPEDFQVCGTDGLTYECVCELKRTACLARDFDLDVASFGPCSTQTPTTEAVIFDP